MATDPPAPDVARSSRQRYPSLGTGAVLDIDVVITAIRRDLLLILAATACGLVLAFALSWAFQPRYEAEVLLQPVDIERSIGAAQRLRDQFGGLASLAGINLAGDDQSQVLYAQLMSRDFTAAFIDSMGLLPILFRDLWDETEERWLPDSPADWPSLNDALELFDKRVRDVSRDKLTGLVTIRITWYDPVVAAKWANELVRQANERVRLLAQREATRSIEFLNAELEKTNVLERRQFIFKLLEEQTQRVMFTNVRDEYGYKVIDPARAPDPDQFHFPNRLLFAVAGAVFGLLLGLAVAVVRMVARPAAHT